jgi:hypothetical protein
LRRLGLVGRDRLRGRGPGVIGLVVRFELPSCASSVRVAQDVLLVRPYAGRRRDVARVLSLHDRAQCVQPLGRFAGGRRQHLERGHHAGSTASPRDAATRPCCAVTTDRSWLAPRWPAGPANGSGCTSSRPANPGATATSSRSTPGSATNAWTSTSSGHSPRPAWSSPTGRTTTTTAVNVCGHLHGGLRSSAQLGRLAAGGGPGPRLSVGLS